MRKPAPQLEEEELETTDDDDDEDLILCGYSVAESTEVLGTVGTRLRTHSCVRYCTSAEFGAFHTGAHELVGAF